MSPALLILFFILALIAIAFVIGIVARNWVVKTEPYRMSGIDVERAGLRVGSYIASVHDHRFGFPTGVFNVEEINRGHIVAREINFKGSAGRGPMMFALALPAIVVGEAPEGCLGAFIGIMVGGFLAALIIIPLGIVTLIELALRRLMRSSIDVAITEVPGEAEAVDVVFELRGLSAFGVEPQLHRGMSPPDPSTPGIGSALEASAAPGAKKPRDRLNTIYAASIAAGIVISIVLTLIVGHNSDLGNQNSRHAGNFNSSGSSSSASSSGSSGGSSGGYEAPTSNSQPAGSSQSGPTAAETRLAAAERVWRAHWQALADKRYDKAYDEFHSSYGATKSLWIQDHIATSADINMDGIKVEPGKTKPYPGELWLYVEVPIKDEGGEAAGDCRLFYGEVRMYFEGGRWWYRPENYRGREPGFANEDWGGGIKDLPESSPRCP